MSKEDITTNELAELINKGFNNIERRFEAVDERFEKVDKRFESIDQRFEHLENTMEYGFEKAALERAQLSTRIDNVEEKLDDISEHVFIISRMANDHEDRLRVVEGK